MKKQNISTTNEIWTIFGERLKTELERQGISLRQFADKAGLTLNTACRYAHSQRTPRATEILKAAEVLHVTSDYMLGLSDDPHKSAQPEPSQCWGCNCEKMEQLEPCEDVVSRNLVLSDVKSGLIRTIDGEDWKRVSENVRDIKALPSAQPDTEKICARIKAEAIKRNVEYMKHGDRYMLGFVDGMRLARRIVDGTIDDPVYFTCSGE